MNKTLFLLLLFVCTVCTSYKCYRNCSHGHAIPFYNNSGSTVYVMYTSLDDTDIHHLFGREMYNPGKDTSDKIYSNQSTEIEISTCVEKSAKNRMQLFVLDADFVATISWDSITRNHLHLKRYDLDEADMETMGWKVTYP